MSRVKKILAMILAFSFVITGVSPRGYIDNVAHAADEATSETVLFRITDCLETNNTEKTYEVKIASRGRVWFSFEHSVTGQIMHGSSFYLSMYDSNNNEIVRTGSNGRDYAASLNPFYDYLDAGTYYFKVERGYGGSSEYTLTVNMNTETAITPNAPIIDGLFKEGAADYYKVTLNAAGKVHLTFQNDLANYMLPSYWHIRLYDSNLNNAGPEIDLYNGGDVKSDGYDLSAGTYYVKVNQDSTFRPSDYILTVNYEANSGQSDEPEDIIQPSWNENWFYKSNLVYDKELATYCAMLSTAVYEKQVISQVLEGRGYNVKSQFADALDEYIFASHVMADGTAVIIVVVQGTDDAEEWIANADAFIGFNDATDVIYADLKRYISSVNATDPLDYKFLITGHSRGGAIANRIAKYLIDDGAYSKRNVYSYTFAAPGTRHRNVGSVNSTEYNCIFNICNYLDYVPHVLPDYGRFGKTLWFNHSWGEWGTWSFANHNMPHYLSWVANNGTYESKYIAMQGWAACPVDLSIYDGGKLIGQVVNNKITVQNTDKLQLLVIGDVKYFWFPENSNYTINFTGTDVGTMDYVIQTVDLAADETLQSKEFCDVQLYKGKSITSDVFGNVSDVKLLATDKNGLVVEIHTDGTEMPSSEWINPFGDVKKSDWFYEAVKYAHQESLVSGTSATTFSPQVAMTRGMMVTILWNYSKNQKARSARFVDVSVGAWYAAAVNWAAANQIVSGIGNNRFAPNNEITREQMAVMLYNYVKFINVELPKKRIGAFVDEAKISAWAKESVSALYAAEIFNGKGHNNFDPQGSATRAEVVAMMRNFLASVE